MLDVCSWRRGAPAGAMGSRFRRACHAPLERQRLGRRRPPV